MKPRLFFRAVTLASAFFVGMLTFNRTAQLHLIGGPISGMPDQHRVNSILPFRAGYSRTQRRSHLPGPMPINVTGVYQVERLHRKSLADTRLGVGAKLN